MKIFKQCFFIAAGVTLSGNLMAWSLFGSGSTSEGRFKSADKLLEKADVAFYNADYLGASNGYERASEKYSSINRDDPGFQNGIADIRLSYCASQIIQCGNMLVAEAGGNADGDADKKPVNGDKKTPATYGTEPVTAKEAFADGFEEMPENPADATEEAYNPEDFKFDFSEARILTEQGRASEAVEILVRLLKFSPQDRKVRILLAAAYLKSGQGDLAIASLEDLRGKQEDLPVLLLISGAYVVEGRYSDAMLALDSAVRIAPANPAPYMNLAWLTLVSGNKNDASLSAAMSYYKQALKRGGMRDKKFEAHYSITE